jgi:hypothetical protein
MKITPKAANAISSAYRDRAMYMAQAEANGVSPDVAADEYAASLAGDDAFYTQIDADLDVAFANDPEFGAAIECAKSARAVRK